MEALSIDNALLAEHIDAAITFHVMGYRAELAYMKAHERDCQVIKQWSSRALHTVPSRYNALVRY
jgi:hypothetical protein